MEKWSFGNDNDNLIKLVLDGKKTATTYIYNPNNIPLIGEQSILVFDSGEEACTIETTDYKILKFKDIDENLSNLEGEGSYKVWKNKHIEFFKKHYNNFTEDTEVVFEIFKLIKKH